MNARPPQALPSITPAEMELLISRTGMSLNAGQMADLVLAWRQVSAIAATIPRRAVPADDFAFAFRLPSPGPGPGARPKPGFAKSGLSKAKTGKS